MTRPKSEPSIIPGCGCLLLALAAVVGVPWLACRCEFRHAGGPPEVPAAPRPGGSSPGGTSGTGVFPGW